MHRKLVLIALFAMMLVGSSAGTGAQSPTPASDAQANKELVLHYYSEVWDKSNSDVVYETLSPDFQWWFSSTELFKVGPDAVKAHADNLNANIEGMGVTVDIALAEGEYVAIRWTFTSTPEGTPSATTVLCTGNDIWRIVDGLAAELWQESVSCA
jgi:hypothetical protein